MTRSVDAVLAGTWLLLAALVASATMLRAEPALAFGIGLAAGLSLFASI